MAQHFRNRLALLLSAIAAACASAPIAPTRTSLLPAQTVATQQRRDTLAAGDSVVVRSKSLTWTFVVSAAVPAPVTPPPPPPVGATATHEPAGMAVQVNTGAITSAPGIFTVFSPAVMTAQGETSANLGRVPDGSGLRVTYLPSLAGGYSPVRFGVALKNAGTGWFYERVRLRFSANFVSPPNTGVKLEEPRTQQAGNVALAFENHVLSVSMPGGSAARLSPTINLQGPNGHFRNIYVQPVTGGVITDGTWHTLEVLFGPESTPGAGNGTYQAWLDGNQVASYADVLWLAAGNAAGWPYLMFDPTWGGAQATQHPPAQYWDLDQLYVSTR